MASADPSPHPEKTSKKQMWGLVVVALAAALLFLFGITGMRIIRAAHESPRHAADAIVVFGAAEYSGHPSPVYKARLDHAYDLFRQGLAPVVITTGGAGLDPDFSEGGVGRDYLARRGIPEQSLIAETQSTDTSQSAERVATIMRTNGMHSCIPVSDAYHVFRIQALLEHEGIAVEVAPRPESRPRSLWQRFEAVMRETASYLVWKMGVG